MLERPGIAWGAFAPATAGTFHAPDVLGVVKVISNAESGAGYVKFVVTMTLEAVAA